MQKQKSPLAEVFGHLPSDFSTTASRYLTFSDEEEAPKAVNVASVPQRSLFRYPGGKT